MTTMHRLVSTLFVSVLLVSGAGTYAVAHDSSGGGGSSDVVFHEGASKLDRLRFSTARYFDVDEAVERGYEELRDAAEIACIDSGDAKVGAMGIHYVKLPLVGDARIRVRKPELMIYEPQADGDLELVGVEYVVLKSAWREAHPQGRPSLFGQRFALVREPNRYGLPPFYELHVWSWRDNPTGLFQDYNPDVTCDHAAPPE
ncbi:MAG: hypothetical protein ACRDOM_07540 [Nocardioides sp.]